MVTQKLFRTKKHISKKKRNKNDNSISKLMSMKGGSNGKSLETGYKPIVSASRPLSEVGPVRPLGFFSSNSSIKLVQPVGQPIKSIASNTSNKNNMLKKWANEIHRRNMNTYRLEDPQSANEKRARGFNSLTPEQKNQLERRYAKTQEVDEDNEGYVAPNKKPILTGYDPLPVGLKVFEPYNSSIHTINKTTGNIIRKPSVAGPIRSIEIPEIFIPRDKKGFYGKGTGTQYVLRKATDGPAKGKYVLTALPKDEEIKNGDVQYSLTGKKTSLNTSSSNIAAPIVASIRRESTPLSSTNTRRMSTASDSGSVSGTQNSQPSITSTSSGSTFRQRVPEENTLGALIESGDYGTLPAETGGEVYNIPKFAKPANDGYPTNSEILPPSEIYNVVIPTGSTESAYDTVRVSQGPYFNVNTTNPLTGSQSNKGQYLNVSSNPLPVSPYNKDNYLYVEPAHVKPVVNVESPYDYNIFKNVNEYGEIPNKNPNIPIVYPPGNTDSDDEEYEPLPPIPINAQVDTPVATPTIDPNRIYNTVDGPELVKNLLYNTTATKSLYANPETANTFTIPPSKFMKSKEPLIAKIKRRLGIGKNTAKSQARQILYNEYKKK